MWVRKDDNHAPSRQFGAGVVCIGRNELTGLAAAEACAANGNQRRGIRLALHRLH